MSFRKQMKDIKKEMLAVKHPLFFEDESLKFSYAIGIALIMMQSDDGHILTLSEHNALNELVLGLDLPEGRLEKVISKAQKTDAKILKEIICKLMKSDYRYLFVLDLLKVANLDKEITLGKREFIDDIMQMMQLSSVETDFLCGFSDAIKTNDQKVANDTVYLALEHSLAPNIEHLQFFLPKFIYEEVIPGFELNSEEFHVLKRSGRVSGKIVIGYGAKLSIKGIELIFSGDAQIVINGGILELEGSTLKATEKSENALVEINRATPTFEAHNCTFDGSGKMRLIATSAGKSLFSGCNFINGFADTKPPVKTKKNASQDVTSILIGLLKNLVELEVGSNGDVEKHIAGRFCFCCWNACTNQHT